MSLSWFLALLVAGLTAWMIRAHLRLPYLEPPRAVVLPAVPQERWHALRLVPGTGGCAAARAQAARLYLPGQAPLTPLADCDCGSCQCHYETIHDRRHGERRSGYDRRTGLRYEPDRSDRRAANDRRHHPSDWRGATI